MLRYTEAAGNQKGLKKKEKLEPGNVVKYI